ncbi:MAG TPA: right-handed parallel beta-helix repeat-containing protein [bacterium]|nr:right-handed parallel beta-helix repeat-containing protein [bacterium]
MKTLLLLFICVVTAASTASAVTIDVSGDGTGDYLTIQEGVNAASNGDTVLVRVGTYTGAGNIEIDFNGTDCILMGQGGALNVTIDCAGAGRAFYFSGAETAACIISGFTITNGATTTCGGAMRFDGSSPTIQYCTITRNSADFAGGGVCCATSSSPAFIGCTFSNNSAPEGGGVDCSGAASPSFESCTFLTNTATDLGGGVCLDGASAGFAACTFEGNGVTDGGSRGGGLGVIDGSTATLYDCLFEGNGATAYGGALFIASNISDVTATAVEFDGNSAEYGAAVAVTDENGPLFDACRFVNNTAVHEGGAVHSTDGAVPEFDECVFDSNSAGDTGGAMHFYWFSTPVVTNCTLYGNAAPTGGGVWCDDNFTLDNCILAFNSMGGAVYCDGDPPYVTCTDIYGNNGGDWTGCLAGLDAVDNNLLEDPLFCAAGDGDFTIDVASPCTAENAPACGLIGAWDVGCDTPVQAQSWGAIKAMYR